MVSRLRRSFDAVIYQLDGMYILFSTGMPPSLLRATLPLAYSAYDNTPQLIAAPALRAKESRFSSIDYFWARHIVGYQRRKD